MALCAPGVIRTRKAATGISPTIEPPCATMVRFSSSNVPSVKASDLTCIRKYWEADLASLFATRNSVGKLGNPRVRSNDPTAVWSKPAELKLAASAVP